MKISKSDIAFEMARRDLIQFSILTMKKYAPNWHHRALARKLEDVESGRIKRLMVFMPPRHGKSELVSVRFPAWFLGRNPDKRVIGSSYSSELAVKFGRQARDILKDEKYQRCFPAISLKDDSKAANRWDVDGGGGYQAVGVGGSTTGFGGHLIMIDDPIKNMEEAQSETYRAKVKEWYQSTLYTRLEKEGAIVLTLTRWHEDDLAGWLLNEMANGGEQWDIISFPAVAEDDEEFRSQGQPLWEDKYNLEALIRMKTAVGSRVWNALYQQRPAPDSGAIFHREWWRFYDVLPQCDSFFQSWDFTFEDADTSDYVVGQVWGIKGADRYLVDQFRERMDFVASIRAIKNMSEKYPQATAKYIEKKANGAAIISALKSEIQGLIPVTPKESKTARAYAVSPIIEAGNVFLKRGAKFTEELIEEATVFPNGKHDDMVDAMTQALTHGGKHAVPAAATTGARQVNKLSGYVNKSQLKGY